MLPAAQADALYPVVSAASICAKVTRDRATAVLSAAAAAAVGGDAVKAGASWLGTGYPADPGTQAYMAGQVQQVFGYPAMVRFSWETTARALEAAGAAKVRGWGVVGGGADRWCCLAAVTVCTGEACTAVHGAPGITLPGPVAPGSAASAGRGPGRGPEPVVAMHGACAAACWNISLFTLRPFRCGPGDMGGG